MKKFIFLIALVVIALSNCTYFNEEELFSDEICDTTNITYNLEIKPIFEQNCYSCHSSAVTYYGNLNLENFADIHRVVNDGKLLRNINHENGSIPMPYQGTKLSDCKINKIENWVNQGIPNN